MSTPQLDALARDWAATHGLDLSPHRDADEPLGATHAQALITEHWEKLTDPQHHYGLEPGSDALHEYIDFVRGIQQSWHEHIERALTNARDDADADAQISTEERLASHLFEHHRDGLDEHDASSAGRTLLRTVLDSLTPEQFARLKDATT